MSRIALLVAAAAWAAAAQTPCESLKSLSLPGTTFTALETVPAAPYQAPPIGGRAPAPPPAAQTGGRAPAPAPILPAHCRVAATLKPSTDSEIKMELWMPVENWNGKFQMVGNGGWAGSISYGPMAAAVRDGYASASTNTGHDAGDAGGAGMFALGHPEKIVDFAWRAVHETVVKSKALIQAYYGGAIKYSYWNGCSTGGRQALVEVTRFPEDFDGVIAGAPANPHIHLHAAGIDRSLRLMKNPHGVLSEAKVQTLHKAVLAACDAKDGVKDGLIADPSKCHFDPSSLLCKGEEDSDSCLTAAQVETVKIVYADIKTRKGDIVWTGYEPGGELQYASLRAVPSQLGMAWDSIRILGHQNADYDYKQFDLDKDLQLADKSGIDALTFDLSAFHRHGGKLLLYHGWADPAIAPGNTVNFYNGVLERMGPKQGDWMRLFMVPGMLHCVGGPGPDQFNKVATLERWREEGKAPDQIIAAHVTGGQVDMTRPLCPYPQVAVYKGTGSTSDAGNFVCKVQ